MLVQKDDEARFLIDTFELKISIKTCDHLPYACVYIWNKELNIIIRALGNTWWYNFYMGMYWKM